MINDTKVIEVVENIKTIEINKHVRKVVNVDLAITLEIKNIID